MDTSPSKSIFPGDLTHWFPEQPEFISPHVQNGGFSVTFAPVNRDFTLDCLIITVAKMATNHYVSNGFLSFNKQKIKKGIFHSQLP